MVKFAEQNIKNLCRIVSDQTNDCDCNNCLLIRGFAKEIVTLFDTPNRLIESPSTDKDKQILLEALMDNGEVELEEETIKH